QPALQRRHPARRFSPASRPKAGRGLKAAPRRGLVARTRLRLLRTGLSHRAGSRPFRAAGGAAAMQFLGPLEMLLEPGQLAGGEVPHLGIAGLLGHLLVALDLLLVRLYGVLQELAVELL